LGIIEKNRHWPAIMSVPQPVIRTAGIAANLLWDKTAYALGVVDPTKTSKRAEKRGLRAGEEEFLTFKKRQQEAIGETSDVGLLALLAFLERWRPEHYAELRGSQDMLDANLVFRLGGESTWLHDTPAARAVVARALGDADAPHGQCLVTGEHAPLARLHPSIKGVRGAQSSGAAIVSFNQPSFTSYGKDQGANAPVSEFAAFAYAAALNGLLADPRHRVQIGDISVVFWTQPKGGSEHETEETTSLVAQFLGGAAEAPDADFVDLDLLSKFSATAKHCPAPGLPIDPSARFFVLGLSPNAGRISVRFWLDTTIQDLAAKLTRHFENLQMEPSAWRPGSGPTIRNLVSQFAPMRVDRDGRLNVAFEHAPDHLAGEFVRAVLSGGDYPYAILPLVLQRLKCDRVVTLLRVALIKAVLVSHQLRQSSQRGTLSEEIDMITDSCAETVGRKLGRLFAIYERAQSACFAELNSSLADKFFASAMSTPLHVFPTLDASFQHRLANIRRGRDLAKWVTNSSGLAGWLLKSVGMLSGSIESIPRQLSIEEQGQFVIGYYKQRFGRDQQQEG